MNQEQDVGIDNIDSSYSLDIESVIADNNKMKNMLIDRGKAPCQVCAYNGYCSKPQVCYWWKLYKHKAY